MEEEEEEMDESPSEWGGPLRALYSLSSCGCKIKTNQILF